MRAILGILCGVAATGPMSAAMVMLHRRLPRSQKYPLPPREITSELARKAGAEPLRESTREGLTLLAHFGYGGAAGALYAALSRGAVSHPIAAGSLFGVGVWTASYLALLPGLRVLTSAASHPSARNALMIGAHLVWGTCLATMFKVLSEDEERSASALLDSPEPSADVPCNAGEVARQR